MGNFSELDFLISNRGVVVNSKSLDESMTIINDLKRNVYNEPDYTDDNSLVDMNPYSRVLYKLVGSPYALNAKDLIYLKDLGVKPLNKLFVLRRYSEGTIVPNNLDTIKTTSFKQSEIPLKVVGFTNTVDEKDLFSINFNEKWTTTNDMLHDVIANMMQNEFGLDIKQMIPIPGFSYGFMFELLKRMGLVSSEWGVNKVPFGDPNVLGEAAIREWDKYGLSSGLEIELETEYEQKFIDGGVDPGAEFLRVVQNLIYMGTSEVKYIFKFEEGAKTGDKTLMNALKNAVLDPGNPNAWWNLIVSAIDSFLTAIKSMLGDLKYLFENSSTKSAENNKVAGKDGLTVGDMFLDNDKKTVVKISNIKDDTISYNFKDVDDEKWSTAPSTTQVASFKKLYPNKVENNTAEKNLQSAVEKFNMWEPMKDLLNGTLKSVMASTCGKYRWPLRGGFAVMTGINTTPWHLTVGNPLSPIISVGNIVVESSTLNFSSELGYNDLPQSVRAVYKVKLGRNLGAQELYRMFGHKYQRSYGTLLAANKIIKETNSNLSPDIVEIKTKVANITQKTTKTQPNAKADEESVGKVKNFDINTYGQTAKQDNTYVQTAPNLGLFNTPKNNGGPRI